MQNFEQWSEVWVVRSGISDTWSACSIMATSIMATASSNLGLLVLGFVVVLAGVNLGSVVFLLGWLG